MEDSIVHILLFCGQDFRDPLMNKRNDLLYVDWPTLVVFNCMIQVHASFEPTLNKSALVDFLNVVIVVCKEKHAVFYC